MGWCSGTDIFDALCHSLLEEGKRDAKLLLKDLIIALENRDWDCQMDSYY